MIDLSVVIVSWNTCELLASCLQSLFETAAGLAPEIIVVDNASTDGSADMVRNRFPQVRLIENADNIGFARANNQAIARSQGRYVLLLNSDTEVRPEAVETLVRFIDETPRAGGAGPYLLNADGTQQPSCYPLLTPWREFWRLLFLERVWRRATYDMARWDTTTPREVGVIKGACLLVRREALDQVGMLDPQYFMYSEELDLCYRLQQAEWHLYWVPGARVVHYGESSTRQMAQAMYVQLYRSKVQFYRKTGGRARARLFKMLLAVAYTPRWLAATAATPFRPGLRKSAGTFRRLLAELPAM